MFRRKLKDFAE
jgi:hypothetical protein